jgi:uncharacterized membrane protein YhhN
VIAAAAGVSIMSVAWLLVAERADSPTRLVAKPLASAGFIAMALASGALDSSYGRWMLVALVLSAIGDVLLLDDRGFLAGLGSFLGAHLAFAGAFLVRGIGAPGLASIVPLGVFGWMIVRWLWPHLPSGMRPPVAAYAVAISVMGVFAIATAAHDWDWRIPLGAVLFIISDTAVARQTFVQASFVNRLWGLPLYYAGQLLLAWAAGG